MTPGVQIPRMIRPQSPVDDSLFSNRGTSYWALRLELIECNVAKRTEHAPNYGNTQVFAPVETYYRPHHAGPLIYRARQYHLARE